mgnify:CR=1 FL=1
MEQKKKALGRGLEELFSTEVLDFDTFESNIMENATTNEIQDIPINEIRPNPYQPRKSFNEEALRELSESIKNHGVFQPIIVKKGIRGYDLIAGERRLRASKMAGLDKIPAIVKDFSDDEMREIALLENIQRENLTAIELAWAYKGIIDNLDIRQEDLALRIGKSRSHITNTLGLLNLPEEVQKMILNGELSMGHARVLSKMEDESKITGLAKKIINEGLSVHEIEEISKDEEIKKRVPITRRERNTDYTNIENELKDIVNMISEKLMPEEDKNWLTGEPVSDSKIFFVNNAGLCLLSAWFLRLLSMLDYLNEARKDIKDTKSRIRAMFLLQYLTCQEEKEYRETELVFNRLLVGLPMHIPLPKRLELTADEKQIADSLLSAVKAHWSKMNGTSLKGFLQSFVTRTGRLEEQDEKWLLTVDDKTHDILLDSVPWGFRQIRLPWLKKYIQVKWHDKQEF